MLNYHYSSCRIEKQMKIGKKLLSQRQDIFVSYDHMEDERTKTTVLKLYRSIIVNLAIFRLHINDSKLKTNNAVFVVVLNYDKKYY